MPDRTLAIVSTESPSDTIVSDVVPRLARLLEHDRRVATAYLCHETVPQVHRLAREGNHFCGYRNIQMLCLALGRSGVLPSLQRHRNVLELQGVIEHAWDAGLNAHARIQTGGIAGTRKHIGASEAEALLLSLDVPCTGTAFLGKDAWTQLLKFVEEYFGTVAAVGESAKVRLTGRMPVFFQRPHHSLTIVGMAKLHTGKRELLVFDPGLPPPSTSRTPYKSGLLQRLSDRLDLVSYRRGERYLKRYTAFELLSIDANATQ